MTLCLICLYGPTIYAREQERSLVDRLLRPNMELQNNAQDQKFAANPAVIEHRGTVGTFLLQPTLRQKAFEDVRPLNTKEFPARSFNGGSLPNLATQNLRVRISSSVVTSNFRGVSNAHDTNNTVPGRSFTDQHPFREEGKSQKSLNRQNPPLTIEQVRELLNKNK